MRFVLEIGDNVVDKYVHLGMMFLRERPQFRRLPNYPVWKPLIWGYSVRCLRYAHSQVLEELNVDTSRCRIHPGENGYARVSSLVTDRVFLPGTKAA